MKKIIGLLSAALLSTSANALILDFEDSANLGVSLGGNMKWKDLGGGHLYNERYNDDDFIVFSSETYVNRFEMNALPWEGYSPSSGLLAIDIAGLNSANQTVWSTTVDLTGYTSWDNWLTVDVETDGILSLAFYAPGNAPHFSVFWPSVDNLVINEAHKVSEPAGIALLGLGLAGLIATRRKRSA